ncbi:MAG: tRNA (guanosine(37)-N1)-methyltransferase TrmD [Methylococcaceae bacterium]|jgi:tRNA (guanine37-N1)-methyltransferase
MRFDIVTLFPEMVRQAAINGVVGRALSKGLIDLRVWNPRDYAEDRYRTVDDRPYGGGPGMVMKVAPLRRTLAAVVKDSDLVAKTIYLSPQGRLLDQQAVNAFSKMPRLILLAGRYEGVDERLIDAEVDEEWSIGDYVLSGGELPALVLFDAITRLIPGVLGHQQSALQDSHMSGLLDYPHYTRPENIEGQLVPKVLQSGSHEAIRRWRLRESLGRTWVRRPDLLQRMHLDSEQQSLLDEYQKEFLFEKNRDR